MKIKTKKLYLPLIFTLLFLPMLAQDKIPDKIIVSLETGNAKVLSDFFDQNVQLLILENDNVYSKAQAQQIVGKFFSDYRPERFEIVQQGAKEGPMYIIGKLVTQKGIFRVYFLLKTEENKSYIHQLRIEKQG